jgi:ATP-dependent Lhr-like helicase
LYLADHLGTLLPPTIRLKPDATGNRLKPDATGNDRETAIIDYLKSHGASFFAPLHEAAGGGYPAETVSALWDLVWRGTLTNDTLHAVRALTQTRALRRRARRAEAPAFRSRRLVPPAAEGRWSLISTLAPSSPNGERSGQDLKVRTKRAAALAQQLLARHGVLTREALAIENVAGGFGAIYPVLKAMEESGRIRRGPRRHAVRLTGRAGSAPVVERSRCSQRRR